MKNKELRFWLMVVVLNLSVVLACAWDYTHRKPVETEDEWIEEYEDVIRWRIDDVDEEIYVEQVEVEVVKEAPELVSLGRFKLTAYCACKKCCFEWSDGITATGTVPTEGRTVAVDPKVIPYGTVLVIDGHEYIAEDCSVNYIHGKEIDIFFDSHSEAKEFGIQYAEVFVKESN